MFAASKSGQVTGSTPPPPTPTNDPQFNYVTALLTGDGTNGAQNNTFIDSSPNNFTVTRAGNTTQGSASPYGGNWSNYFNGSNYLSVATNAAFALPSDFTFECWFYSNNTSTPTEFFEVPTIGGLQIYYNGSQLYVSAFGDLALMTYTYTVPIGTWVHLAVVRNGTGTGNLKFYVNGVSVASATTNYSFVQGAARVGGNSYYFNGFLSNVRLVKGTAVYATNFTPSTTPLTAITNTSLLTCQSPTFVDNSINNFAITNTGSVAVQSFSAFEPATLTPISYSGYFNGSTDYLSLGASTNLALGAGNFTIECWLNITAYNASTSCIFEWRFAGGVPSNIPTLYISASGVPTFYASVGSGPLITGSSAITLNTWTHLAIVRNGTTVTMYLNGTSIGSATNSANLGNESFYINDQQPSYRTNAYFSNVRMVIGTAVYTANFTPSTTPLTAISGTSLLTCQSNYFVDNSVNNFSITPVGSTKTTIQNPFGTTSYSQYFDGSGDYLTVSASGANFGTGNFTIELWVYRTTSGADENIFVQGVSGSGGYGLAMFEQKIRVRTPNITDNSQIGTTIISPNSWYHITLCRSGTTTRLFVNGALNLTISNDTSNETATTWNIAHYGSGDYVFTGYLSNLRTTNTAVYTANFNPPTAPLTAITGTSLLTCQNITAIDNSPNAFTITTYGNTRGSLANPFPFGTTSALTTGYSSSVASGSVYLNSPTSYLSVANNTALNITSGSTDSFVCQFWVNFSTVSVSTSIVDNGGQNGASFSNWAINLDASRQFQLVWGDSGSPGSTVGVLPSTVIPVANTWYHIAFVKTNADWAVFINGTRQITFNGLNTASKSSSTPLFIGYGIASGAGGSSFVGCISNLQIYKGASASAPYAATSTTISVPTSPLTATTNTQLLTCQSSTSITDASTNAFTITSTGTPTPKIANPFGITSVNGSSIFLDGTGDYLLTPANSAITAFGTGDFTVEAWVYTTAFPHANGMFLFDARTSGNPNNWCIYLASGDSLVFLYNGAYVASTASTFYQNRWYHIAYSRSGTSGKLFVNGVVVSSPTDTNNYSQTTILTVGGRYTQDYSVQGYMSSVRIVKGTALYKSAFVPPSAPVVTPSGTSLLLNGTNAGIFDNAMMSNYETVGNSQISTTVKKYGTGSMYFDGSASYLFAPTSNVDNLSKFLTSNFTVECWIYPTTSSGDRTIICAVYSWGAGANYMIELRSGLLFVQLGDSITMTSGTTSISANTWTHIALVRSGLTSTTFYVNGVSVATSASNWTANEDCPLTVGCFNTNGGGLSNYWLGYIDDLRITKGYARYVANFTPPTQAFPTY